jgi:chromate transporter
MNLIVLYLYLLKATLTSFSGLTSLPIIRQDLVVHRGVLTDRQLTAAVAAGRAVPGPNGSFVVSVGYFIAGAPGAAAGWLAMVTPSFVIILLLNYLGPRAEKPRVRSAIEAVTLSAAGLIVWATIPLAQDAVTTILAAAIALGSFAMTAFTQRNTLWIFGGSALIGLLGYAIR